MGIEKKYSNGEVTIVWKPEMCIHSALCVNGLPGVFDTGKKPWINAEGASTQAIIDQVSKCPSGALSYYRDGEEEKAKTQMDTKVQVMENGPLLVSGTLEVTHKDGSSEMKNKTTAFCRCGASANKPYCDGSHVTASFVG